MGVCYYYYYCLCLLLSFFITIVSVNNASTSAVQCFSPSPQNPLLHLEAYFSWLDYCDQVVAGAPQVMVGPRVNIFPGQLNSC